MKQLQHEIAHAVLHEGCNGRMAEGAIGLARHAGEIAIGDRVPDERTDHLDRDFRIGPAGEPRDGLGIEPRPSRGHVEATVAGKPRKRGLDKAERRGFPPGGDVAHGALGSDRGCAALRRASHPPTADRITY